MRAYGGWGGVLGVGPIPLTLLFAFLAQERGWMPRAHGLGCSRTCADATQNSQDSVLDGEVRIVCGAIREKDRAGRGFSDG